MSRGSGYQREYGLVGAGAVNASLIGRLSGKLGPVAGVSYRVASRIANTLQSGTPVRSVDELDGMRLILFHAPPEQMETLTDLLKNSKIRWAGKSLIFFDCEDSRSAATCFRARGASVAAVRPCGIPGRVLVEGIPPALTMARALARTLRMKPVEIAAGCEVVFDAAITLGSGALTPLIDRAAALFRQCGIRDPEALRLAASLVENTAREYAHSGKQSWAWHTRRPDAQRLGAEIAASGELQALFAELLLLGFEGFEKHPEAARALRAAQRKGRSEGRSEICPT
ncbi:MAG: DUF2520 domain-containing protein [Bryobacteraceae bacterium]|jgi:hypothetical protein